MSAERPPRLRLRRRDLGWFLVAAGNLVYGVSQAGYGLAEELPIALLIFLVPAAPAAILLVRSRRA